MPITYAIDLKQNIIFTTATGVLTDEELLSHKRNLVADPQFKPGMVELSDGRQITRLKVTVQGVRSLVKQDMADAQKLRDYKLAIVVSQDVVFGLARMYQMMTQSSNPNVAVFRDLEKAKIWLDSLRYTRL